MYQKSLKKEQGFRCILHTWQLNDQMPCEHESDKKHLQSDPHAPSTALQSHSSSLQAASRIFFSIKEIFFICIESLPSNVLQHQSDQYLP